VDIDGFWTIIGRSASPQDLLRQLDELPPSDLADFEIHHATQYARSYDWGLWGAAYIIFGGCSDDGFDYFRAWLVSRGREIYERALSDPESLADVDLTGSEDGEAWMSPTMYVVHRRTGAYGYVAQDRHPPRPEEPTGEDWDEQDLDSRFPRLWAAFGD
jgi:hypothetical protein